LTPEEQATRLTQEALATAKPKRKAKPKKPRMILPSVGVVYSVDPSSARDNQIATWQEGRLTFINARSVPFKIRKADPVVVEDQFPGRNGGSALDIAKAAGHFVGSIGRRLTEVVWSHPASWKAQLCGKDRKKTKTLDAYPVHHAILRALDAAEAAVYQAALMRHGSQPAKMDVADAVGIGLVALGRIPPKP
jgi:hypothetical protein